MKRVVEGPLWRSSALTLLFVLASTSVLPAANFPAQPDTSTVSVGDYWLRWRDQRALYDWGVRVRNSGYDTAVVALEIMLVDDSGAVLHREVASVDPVAIPPGGFEWVERSAPGELEGTMAGNVRGMQVRVRLRELQSAPLVPPRIAEQAAEWTDRRREHWRYRWSALIENPNPFHVELPIVIRHHDAAGALLYEATTPLILPPAMAVRWRGTGSADGEALGAGDHWTIGGADEGATHSPRPVSIAAAGLEKPVQRASELPEYTPAAVLQAVEGDVIIEAIVTIDGSVANAVVVSSVGDEELDARALEAVGKWRFDPGTRNGVAVPVIVGLSVAYRLGGR